MKSIDILVEEHCNIIHVLKIIRKVCLQIVDGGEVYHQDFFDMIDFIRNYADKYHHGKEEDLLFLDMAQELGETMANGPIQGMLLEHDMGRRFVKLLEEAVKKHLSGDEDAKVDIIANAIGYANLLHDHIDKENNVIYPFASKQLKDATKNKLDQEFEDFECQSEHKQKREKYYSLIKKLQAKYL